VRAGAKRSGPPPGVWLFLGRWCEKARPPLWLRWTNTPIAEAELMPENTTSSATSHPELLQAHRSAFNQQRTLLRAQALLFGDLFALARHTLTQALVAQG
jgi:hypothetical protein